MALAPGSVLYYKNDGTSETVSAASQFNFDNDCYIHSVLGVETIGFARDGYSFVSWNTASDGSGDSYNEGDTYTFSARSATSSLYAIWEEVPPVPYLTTDTDLTAVADAIREKGGTSAELEWPSGYVDAIGDISGNAYTLTTVVPQQTFTPQEISGSYQTPVTYTAGLEDGESYLVTFDGEQYICECGVYWGTEYLAGYVDLFWGTRVESPYPFGIGYSPSVPEFSVSAYDTNSHTIKVEHLEFVDGPLNLILKSVTANGTYSASSDNADGYSSVTVDVPSGGGTAATVSVEWTLSPMPPGAAGPTFYYVGSDGTYRSYECEEMGSPTSLSVLVPSIIAVEGGMLTASGSIDLYTTPNYYYRLAFVYGNGEISSDTA